MTPHIRKARCEDLPGILDLFRELRPNDPELPTEQAKEIFEDLLSRDFVHLLVCELNGELVATCTLAVVPNLASGGQPYSLIEHVITLAAHRGQGLGRIIVQHAMDLAWSLNCYKVMLLSGAARHEAHQFYESLGFNGDVERGFVAKRVALQL